MDYIYQDLRPVCVSALHLFIMLLNMQETHDSRERNMQYNKLRRFQMIDLLINCLFLKKKKIYSMLSLCWLCFIIDLNITKRQSIRTTRQLTPKQIDPKQHTTTKLHDHRDRQRKWKSCIIDLWNSYIGMPPSFGIKPLKPNHMRWKENCIYFIWLGVSNNKNRYRYINTLWCNSVIDYHPFEGNTTEH